MTRRSRLLFLGFSLIAAAVCARLGVWQLARLRERRATNQRVLAARRLPPVDLDAAAGAGQGDLVNRRVEASGVYDFDAQFVVRRQALNGSPGVRIVTPLRPSAGDSAVLVIRGFVPSPDAASVELDSLSEAPTQTVKGTAVAITAAPSGGEPLQRGRQLTWDRLDLADVRARLRYPVRAIAILQSPDTTLPHYPVRLEPVPLDDGPHLSYAVQWFGFGLVALVGGVVMVRKN